MESFPAAASTWIEAAPTAAENQRRRLVAVTAALELATQGLRNRWQDARLLVEAGCKLLRQSQEPPTPFEMLWHAAALALIEGAGDDRFLLAQADPYTYIPRALGDAYDHLSHVRGRFPNEARVTFVLATATERASFPEPPRKDPWITDFQKLAHAKEVMLRGGGLPGPETMRLAREFDRRTRMLSALSSFALVRSDPVLGAEATLRSGKILSRLRRLDEALALLSDVRRRSSDRQILHLAQLFTGEILEWTNLPEGAVQAYRESLTTMPDAQTSTLRLAALMTVRGDVSEASRLMATISRLDGQGVDPWVSYGYGTYRHLPELLASLRAAVNRGRQ